MDEPHDTVKFLNESLKGGISSLSNLKSLYETLKQQKEQLIDKPKQETVDGSNSSVSTLEIPEQLVQLDITVQGLEEDLAEHVEKVSQPLPRLSSQVKKVSDLESCQSYLRCLDYLENLSVELQAAISKDSTDGAIDCYEEMVSLFQKLTGTSCRYLLEYLRKTIKYWHATLKDRINKELTGLMKVMEWPFIATITTQKVNSTAVASDPQTINSTLCKIFKQLLRIQLPASISHAAKEHPIILSLPQYRQPLLPMELMVAPLQKRFKFHFYGNKQTNSQDKPEWYFTQLLTWAKDHTDYITSVVQPALWNAGYDFVNANLEFLKSLHMMAMEKLISSINDIMFDEHLYSHLIHETLSFHGDMASVHDYPRDEASCLHALTAEEPFRKWIVIEKKFAQDKMDMMMSSETAWCCQYNADLGDDDYCKTAECAESFIALLNAITERYKQLPYPVCQLMFVCMKQELLEDYRVRLVQLRKEFSPTSPQYLAILNTTHHIVSVLNEWTETPFFLKLQYQKSLLIDDGKKLSSVLPTLLSKNASYQLPQPMDVSAMEELECKLFDDSIENICSLEGEMLRTLTNHVVSELRTKLKIYADNNQSMWTALGHLKHKDEQHMISLSATACEFIIHLQNSLVLADEGLHKQLFNRFWQQVAQELDSLIYQMVITENHFSEGGVVQFNFDMTRNLFPAFGKYTSKPENSLKIVKESCHLLTLQLGDALLLKSTLYESLHSVSSKSAVDPIGTVQEQGIFKLTPEDVELVLSRRNDLLRNY